MTLTNSSRKRQCSDESEYLPVTKRMNNLHIDVSSNDLNESNINGQQIAFNGLEIPLDTNQSYCYGCHQNQSHNSMNSSKIYSPELDSNENPIYYESNRILYEAHQQRISRNTNIRLHSTKN